MDEIHILQLGEKDWNDLYTLPETVYLDHIDIFSKTALKSYDLFFSRQDTFGGGNQSFV